MSQIIGMKRGFYEIKYNTIHSQSKTLASEMSLTAAASTIFLITNFLMALSLGTQRAQLVQRMGCTCPRPFLARPLFLLFLVCQNTIRVTNDKVNLSKMLKQKTTLGSLKNSAVLRWKQLTITRIYLLSPWNPTSALVSNLFTTTQPHQLLTLATKQSLQTDGLVWMKSLLY